MAVRGQRVRKTRATKRSRRKVLVALTALTFLAACGRGASSDSTTANATAAAPPSGLLAEVKTRGKLWICTDANYEPQSFKNPDGSWEGFDIDVGREIAKRLGVEAEFFDSAFSTVTAGDWKGRWDLNLGSMTITPERQKLLLFSVPYYYTPAMFVVATDSPISAIQDLKSKWVGVSTASTYHAYMLGVLTLPEEKNLKTAPWAQVKSYGTDQDALKDLVDRRRLDAVLTALPTIQDAIKRGQPLKTLGEPVYYEALALALDQKSPSNPKTLLVEIDRIIQEMHRDGTLTRLSKKYYSLDLTRKQ